MRLFKLLVPVLISIMLIVLDVRFSYLDKAKRYLTTAISPIYFVVDLPGQIVDWVNEKGGETERLVSENEHLKSELIELKAKLQTFNNLVLENQKITNLLDASYSIPEYQVKLAQIKSISQSRLKKQLVINKGSNDGIRFAQIALGSNGVVGQVTVATPLYATIQLATDPTQHIPVKNVRNGTRGITKGLASNENAMIVEFIQLDSDIKIGDVFVTSGIDSRYPPGYPVGEVVEVDSLINNAFLSITLEPMQDMNQLEFILIVSQQE